MPIIAGNIDIYATEILLHRSGLAVSRCVNYFSLNTQTTEFIARFERRPSA